MSDGNYNRNLLPYNSYQSGMKAGKSMARMKALEAFKEYLNGKGNLSEEEFQKEVLEFKALIERYII